MRDQLVNNYILSLLMVYLKTLPCIAYWYWSNKLPMPSEEPSC